MSEPLGPDGRRGTPERSEQRGDVLFSIVIPVWNREDTIQRCLDSCLSQNFDRFEIVAVDDASTDRSVEIMESYADPRLRIIRLASNRQVSYARNEGSRRARGKWLVYLDSDDALLPGYLKRLAKVINERGVAVITCPYLHDDGPMSPYPMPQKDELDFAGYLGWWEAMSGNLDMLVARRRDTWVRIPYPMTRARQMLTNLRVYSHYKMLVLNEPGGMVYTDAVNRHNSDISACARKRWRRDAPDMGESFAQVVREFGGPLKRYAPRRYREVLRAAPFSYFAGGNRWLGLRYMLRYLREYPLCIKGWMYLALGLMGPAMVVWGKAWSLAKNRAGR